MKRTLQLVLFLFFFSFIWESYGQTITNIQALNDLSVQFNSEYEQNRAEVIEYARINNIPVRFETEDAVFEMQYIDEFGKPQYYKTENKNAAATVSTNRVHTGGAAGLNLDGSGMTVYEWDAGGVLLTHQEFGGRATMGDATTGTHSHSTHVAGTMVASGVDEAAKGMAPEAELVAFDWSNDISEMGTAAANGALVSNHSYGYSRGWTWNGSSYDWYGNPAISTQEDYLFGFYDSYTQNWDQVAYNAPYYLIVKSAGNDRNEGPTGGTYPKDGPYDCIGQQGVAKNVLTVGAIEDIPFGYAQPEDVVMSSFSSWGPADDGRIKPDIVANGVGLYSTYNGNNTDYYSISGTSMASPSVTGSLILLQEHYENLNGTGNYMRAATLKALVIHTADEAGTNLGPDYQNGWGLLNINRAAAKITEDQTNDVISEHTLSNGGTYTTNITATSGYPIKVTVVWTDPKGTPVAAALDPSNVMLVNDLDLRVTGASTTHYPWRLTRNSPADAALRNSENNVDNVEVVLIESPTPGANYTITVDHDGTLAAPQAFSMIISGYPLAPNANFFTSTKSCGLSETVNLTDASTENPTSWTWSISPGAYTFVNGTSATSQNPEIQFTASGSYDISLTASNSSGSNTETKLAYITASDAPTGYCAAYSTNPAGNIENFQFGSISNNHTGYTNIGSADPDDQYYQDFTNIMIDVIVGETYTLTVLNGYDGTGSDLLDLSVWIDFNRDIDFEDTGEQVVCDIDNYGEGTFSVTIPSNASIGATRLRARVKYSGSDCGSSCGSTANGEVEDYTINIKPLPPPSADFTADKTLTLINTTVNFTDQSLYTPTTWLWSFNPSTVTFVGGTSYSSQNPQVQFTAAGTYEVSLYIENAIGNDTKVKTGYLSAYNLPPTACPATGGGGTKAYIKSVVLNTISNINTTSDNYHDYTSLSTELNILGNYNITVTNGYVRSGNDLAIWIDWNQDGDFDDVDENILCKTNGGQGTFYFDVPATANLGSSRLRIRTKNAGTTCGSSCDDASDGEVEDYTIIVRAGNLTWDGSESTDWDNPNNWDGGVVPNSKFHAIIPGSTPFSPTIGNGKSVTCSTCTIQSGATLIINGDLTQDNLEQ